ncbi:glycine-rich domain-containing protein [Flavobacterium ajazii]|uniref:glycine-rich domain-containing protein n=1 Tax=Flavobacterium ajazii TaxID=2692318 RepID=UPI0013D38EA9|nr:hypothetical protein [Flavobacterium ajazii]
MRLKLPLLLFFVYSFTWSQITFSPSTTTAGNFKVPAGVTSMSVECWGAGGAGGGVTAGLSLFAGGGGGGGAYCKVANLSVTPAVTLSYKVGAGGTSSNGADGTNGEQTFFSTVSANGGVGGKFGNPSLGAGGAGGAVSATGTTFSGGNGAGAAILSLVTINSGGGGGAAGTASNGGNANNATAGTGGSTGGGAGATGVIALFNDGADGTVPGGGGSGGASILSVSGGRKGGSGGNGKLNVVYTCPTYSFTNITAADVCLSNGTTSLVTLTGPGLPQGDYVVTYNTSNPSATGLTANATVSGAGAGTLQFTATGLNSNGSCTITVTRLTSEACLNNFTTGNTVSINVYNSSVGGTINVPPAICSGNTSGLLTLTGHTGSVVKWQYAVSPFSTWTDIPNTTTSYTSGPLTQTTQFRAVIKNGNGLVVRKTLMFQPSQ